jgi:hypothetical protein
VGGDDCLAHFGEDKPTDASLRMGRERDFRFFDREADDLV